MLRTESKRSCATDFGRYGHYHIADEHYGYTGDHTLGEAPAVGDPSADERHEINESAKEAGIDLTRHS